MPLHPCTWLDVWTDENVQDDEPPDEKPIDRRVPDLVKECLIAAKIEGYTKKNILECSEGRLDLYIDAKIRRRWLERLKFATE